MKLKKILWVVVVSALTLFSMNAQARNGIYVTAEGGVAKLTNLPTDLSADVSPIRQKDTASFPSGMRVSVGYNHDLCRYRWLGLGVNVGLARYGQETYYYANNPNTQIRVKTVEFLGVVTMHLKRNVDLFGQAGGVRETVVTSGYGAIDNHTDSRPKAVIGAAYNFNPHVAAIISYAHIFGLAKNFNYIIQPENPSANIGLVGVKLSC